MKKFLFSLLLLTIGLVVVYGTLCYFGPKNLNVTVSSSIKAPALMVYNQVNNLDHWQQWSDWNNTIDSSMKITYTDKQEGQQAGFDWYSDTGKGSVKIDETVLAKNVKINYLSESDKSQSEWRFTAMSKKKSSVEISFTDTKEIPFIVRGYKLLTGAKYQVKKSLQRGLEKIEKIVELQAAKNIYNTYKIQDIEQPKRHYVLKRGIVDRSNIQQFYAQNLGSLFQYLQKEDIEMSGMPSGLFFSKGVRTDMAAAIPIKDDIQFDELKTLTIPKGNALQIDYYGDIKKISKAHRAIQSYLSDHSLFNDPPIIEEYITDPSKEKDPSKWLTKITYYYSE